MAHSNASSCGTKLRASYKKGIYRNASAGWSPLDSIVPMLLVRWAWPITLVQATPMMGPPMRFGPYLGGMPPAIQLRLEKTAFEKQEK